MTLSELKVVIITDAVIYLSLAIVIYFPLMLILQNAGVAFFLFGSIFFVVSYVTISIVYNNLIAPTFVYKYENF